MTKGGRDAWISEVKRLEGGQWAEEQIVRRHRSKSLQEGRARRASEWQGILRRLPIHRWTPTFTWKMVATWRLCDTRRVKSLLPELHSPCTYLQKLNPALNSCADKRHGWIRISTSPVARLRMAWSTRSTPVPHSTFFLVGASAKMLYRRNCSRTTSEKMWVAGLLVKGQETARRVHGRTSSGLRVYIGYCRVRRPRWGRASIFVE